MTVDLDALSGHTPGPWEWHTGRDYDRTIRRVGGSRLLSCGTQYAGGYEPSAKDARLIAAAPDLLALCREQMAEIERIRGLLGEMLPYVSGVGRLVVKDADAWSALVSRATTAKGGSDV